MYICTHIHHIILTHERHEMQKSGTVQPNCRFTQLNKLAIKIKSRQVYICEGEVQKQVRERYVMFGVFRDLI